MFSQFNTVSKAQNSRKYTEELVIDSLGFLGKIGLVELVLGWGWSFPQNKRENARGDFWEDVFAQKGLDGRDDLQAVLLGVSFLFHSNY